MQLRDQWDNIDWKKAEKHVNRLQVRITKAVKIGKWHLVKRLQFLITHSYYAKLLAIRKPTQN
ncbi:MAG TPA: reverse transcriptase N-terminal domain-containing protein, partial [Candidatus Saccharimonadales bacterium]